MQQAPSARERAEQAARDKESALEALAASRERELESARREATRIVEKARREATALMEELDALRRQKEAADFASRTQQVKSQLRSRLRRLDEAADPVMPLQDEEYTLPRDLVAGDTVLLVDMGLQAVVIKSPDAKGVVEVQAGAIRTRTTVDNLRLYESKRAQKKGRTVAASRRQTGGVASRMERSVVTDLDLRGMTVEEALLEVDRFLDNAVLCGLERVTLIHGKGTGALRAGIQQHLKQHKQVNDFRLGVYGEGETGVTIVELK